MHSSCFSHAYCCFLSVTAGSFELSSTTRPNTACSILQVFFGGSCTGTGIFLVLAARSVGIPTRIEGCSESVVRGDDHHWASFYDPADAGPFGDFWHTKEGESAGNEGGPWDAPSGPMSGCLQGVVPGSAMDSLWASVHSSDVQLPLLWANDTTATEW